jgi:hypothetical protein
MRRYLLIFACGAGGSVAGFVLVRVLDFLYGSFVLSGGMAGRNICAGAPSVSTFVIGGFIIGAGWRAYNHEEE